MIYSTLLPECLAIDNTDPLQDHMCASTVEYPMRQRFEVQEDRWTFDAMRISSKVKCYPVACSNNKKHATDDTGNSS